MSEQTSPPTEILLAGSLAHKSAPMLASLAQRIGAAVVDSPGGLLSAINDSAARATGNYLAILPPGYRLAPGCLEVCAGAFALDDRALAVAPAVSLQSADGLHRTTWRPPSASFVDLIADPRTTPSFFVVPRSVWLDIGGLDESLGVLAEYDLCLTLASKGRVPLLSQELIACDAGDGGNERWRVLVARDDYLHAFRRVLEKHKAAIERELSAIVPRRERTFGQLRDAHRILVQARDDGLAELDRLRAGVAHGRAWLAHHGRDALDWGDLRRTSPISRDWGYDRGTPVDRSHIEAFVAAHSSDIQGVVLEVQEDDLTLRLGGPRVTQSDVLDIDDANPLATVVADLRYAAHIPSDRYDCVLLTQTLHVIDEAVDVLRECHRILKPAGVLLATMPAASRVCLEYGERGDFWRVTPAGARALFASQFGNGAVQCTGYGNVLTTTAFLHGVGREELSADELGAYDPYFPALVGIRATKTTSVKRAFRKADRCVLLYHRIDNRRDAYNLSVSLDRFAAHLDWLRQQCSVLPLEQLLGTPAEQLPENAVALTFDDGYIDNLTAAAPLLEAAGLPATFFLTTRWLDEPGEYWWDGLERVLLEMSDIPPRFDWRRGDEHLVLDTGTSAERAAAHRRLHDWLVHATLDMRDDLMQTLRVWAGACQPRQRPMLADEIRTLMKIPGVSIGAHSVNHLALPDQAESVQRLEIDDSRSALQRVLGEPVAMFAYPYGAADDTTVERVRRDWRWGIACGERAVGESFDAGRVSRVEVNDWDVDALSARVRGALS